jgi:hypothetical protein
VVLAGDIHNGFRGVVYADQISRYLNAPVVMVAGNHEFYHHDTETLLPALRAASSKTAGRVEFLENAAASFSFAGGDLTILGCTLWTDYRLNQGQDTAMLNAQLRMNDHRFIASNGAAFTPADALHRHGTSRRWLHEALAGRTSAARCVIVTHHAPSATMLGSRSGEIAPAYASNILDEFALYQPALWIHGHTHYRHDTVESGIRSVSAPRGYVSFDGPDALNYAPGIVEL